MTRVATSDVCGAIAIACTIAGVAWLHPAFGLIVAGVTFGFISVELAKQEIGGPDHED